MTSFLTSFPHIFPLCVGGVGGRARGSAAARRGGRWRRAWRPASEQAGIEPSTYTPYLIQWICPNGDLCKGIPLLWAFAILTNHPQHKHCNGAWAGAQIREGCWEGVQFSRCWCGFSLKKSINSMLPRMHAGLANEMSESGLCFCWKT